MDHSNTRVYPHSKKSRYHLLTSTGCRPRLSLPLGRRQHLALQARRSLPHREQAQRRLQGIPRLPLWQQAHQFDCQRRFHGLR